MNTFPEVELGDSRLSLRYKTILDHLSNNPQEPFPKVFTEGGQLQGFYRLLNHPKIMPASQMDPFFKETSEKIQTLIPADIVVPHDTTDVCPKSNKNNLKGFNKTHGKYSPLGFFAHLSLAVDPQSRGILGPLALKMWGRNPSKKEKKESSTKNKEADRWFENIEFCENLLKKPGVLVHVSDRESDSYELLASLISHQYRFIIRMNHNRTIDAKSGEKVSDLLAAAPCLATREIELSCREQKLFIKSKRKIHPDRDARTAQIEIRALCVNLISSPKRKKRNPDSIQVNIIHVKEVNLPTNQPPVEWYLMTSEKIENSQDVQRIVDYYRCRWVIEEYFKALKTGCSLEDRLIDDIVSWQRLVALVIPIACQLYNLKVQTLPASLPQNALEPSLSKNKIGSSLSSIQLAILKMTAAKAGRPLDTPKDALYEIARLGGHNRYSGPPGWITLFRGFRDLLNFEQGYLLGRLAISDNK